MRPLLPSLMALGLAASASQAVLASELEAAPAGVVHYLSGFDAATHTGLFQQVDATGSVTVLDRRQDWTLQEVHPVPLGSTQGVLLIWKDFPAQTRVSPQLWADGEVLQGFEELPTLNRVWPAPGKTVEWTEAKHDLQVRQGVARLLVRRSLTAENADAPLLRKKEVYVLGAEGARLEAARTQDLATPAQRLNWMADAIELAQYRDLPGQLSALREAPAEYHERALILLTRVPMNRAAWMTSRDQLDALVMAGGPTAERAAERLFQMVQREWKVGAR